MLSALGARHSVVVVLLKLGAAPVDIAVEDFSVVGEDLATSAAVEPRCAHLLSSVVQVVVFLKFEPELWGGIV
jgi:hypothetical protein